MRKSEESKMGSLGEGWVAQGAAGWGHVRNSTLVRQREAGSVCEGQEAR